MNRNIPLYIIGCVLFSLGATNFIISNTGTDPLDVFCLGLQNHLDIKVGTIQSDLAILFLTIHSGLRKWKFPPLSSFLTFFICGYMIDFFRHICGIHTNVDIFYLIIGTFLCLVGSATIIASDIGVRPIDLVSLELENKTKNSFWIFKFLIEVILLLSGYLMGGPVGIGTVTFLIVVGGFIKPCVNLIKKL
jgi:uncharacterized protein